MTIDDKVDDWELVWADEFNRDDAPDSNKWTVEQGMLRNNELQHYTDRPENVRVENGCLILEARKESWENAGYTSASVTTTGKASWTYGRFEVRAKIPKGRGIWPAIWMLGDAYHKKNWPVCGEIDIMENVGFDHNRIRCSVHTTKYNHRERTERGASIDVSQPSADFHVYAAEWSPREILFTFDGREIFKFANEGTGEDAWPFDRPHALILNVAVGGDWGGLQGVDDTVFPQRMLVEYVHVYHRNA